MITIFENFINEKYIHYINIKPNCIIDPLVNFKGHLSETKKNVDYINKFLRSSGKSRYQPSCLIKVYHGTSPDLPILKEGLKTTKLKTSHSYQSTFGYTYFSIYPSMAKNFGDIGWGINNSVVYECLIPICEIEPDKDQLANAKRYGKLEVEDTLGDSIIYGDGIRVKGDIPPYMIKIHNNKTNENFKIPDDSHRILSWYDYNHDRIVYLTKDGKVKKVFTDPNNYDLNLQKKYFSKYSDIFPIVYDITENTITVEYLDDKKAKKEFNEINTYLKKNYKVTFYNYLYGQYKKPILKINFKSVEFSKEMKIIVNRFKNLMNKIMSVYEESLLDVHSDNFGYDKDGNLKMLDI